MTQHEYQTGDIVELPTSYEDGIVTEVRDEGTVVVLWPSGLTCVEQPEALRPVPVNADHIGQWARGVGIYDRQPRSGRVSRFTSYGALMLSGYACNPNTAVLVAAPDDAPTPDPVDKWAPGDSLGRWPLHRPDPAPDTTGGSMRPMAPTGLGPAPCAAPDATGQQDEGWSAHGPVVTDGRLTESGAVAVVAMFADPVDAARAVADRAEVQRLRESEREARDRLGRVASEGIAEQERSRLLRAEVAGLRALVTQVEDARDRNAVSARDLGAKLARVQAELAVARAQGATSTDGLGLPHVEVRPQVGGLAATVVGRRGSTWVADAWSTEKLRADAAVAVHVLRDRLAREAQTPAPDEDTTTVDEDAHWLRIRRLEGDQLDEAEEFIARVDRLAAAAARRVPGADQTVEA